MKSPERKPALQQESAAEQPVGLRLAFDKGMDQVAARQMGAEQTIHDAQRGLRGTPEAGAVDGALADLRAADARMHESVLTALGGQAERAHPAEAQALVQRGRDLLSLEDKFAAAA